MNEAEADRHIRAIEDALAKVPTQDARAAAVKAIGEALKGLLHDAKGDGERRARVMDDRAPGL